jgi:hypothetical protein
MEEEKLQLLKRMVRRVEDQPRFMAHVLRRYIDLRRIGANCRNRPGRRLEKPLPIWFLPSPFC